MKDLTPTMLVGLGGLAFTVLSFLGARLWYGGERKGGADARAAGTTQYMALILAEVQGGRADTAAITQRFTAHCLEQAAQLARVEEQRRTEIAALEALQADQDRQDALMHQVVEQLGDHRAEIAVFRDILERDGGHEVTLRHDLDEMRERQAERMHPTEEPLRLTPPPWRGEDIHHAACETAGIPSKVR